MCEIGGGGSQTGVNGIVIYQVKNIHENGHASYLFIEPSAATGCWHFSRQLPPSI